MKNLTLQLRLASLLSLILLAWTTTAAYGQITPLGDTYTSSTAPTTNYGAQKTLDVDAAKEITYIQFNLSSVPTGASVSQATLKLYVNTVTTAGAFELYAVNGTWSESSLTYDDAPALGSVIDSNVPITTADKNQYILIPMTSTVQGWLNTPSSNYGIALVAVGSFNATFDSKETTTTSHSAELDIVFAGDGTITGVTTSSGSGLIGGGTSGTLNLSLTNACTTNQVLQWNGSAWICAAVGTGTVTSVGSGTGLTGGPITGSGTLSIAANACASGNALSALPFTCSPFATLGANTFSGNQTVSGNLSATGVVSGSSYQIGSSLFAFGSYPSANAFFGFAGNTTTTGSSDTAVGYTALVSNTTGYANTATGYGALYSNTTGYQNTAVGNNPLVYNNTGNNNSAIGYQALFNNTTGNYNSAVGYNALFFNYTGSGLTCIGANCNNGADGLTNATAIGYQAFVSESNALVLGSINGMNGATSNVNVGIGTSAPSAPLEVENLTTTVGGKIFVAEMPNLLANNASAIIGDPGCDESSGNMGLQLGQTGMSNCSNYTLIGNDSGGTYLNANSGQTLHLRIGNSDELVVSSSGVSINGTLSKGSGSFKIDHPLDPANKYLYHSFVESPDMMNIYNGTVVLDARGSAWITLPDYFEALNQDFRYQLTAIGKPGPNLYIAKKIEGNRFRISGGKPDAEVSWQVTGIRHDAYADAHRIQVEVEKPPQEQGRYLHPELFGAPAEQAVGYDAPPVPMRPPTQIETAHVPSSKAPSAPLQ